MMTCHDVEIKNINYLKHTMISVTEFPSVRFNSPIKWYTYVCNISINDSTLPSVCYTVICMN